MAPNEAEAFFNLAYSYSKDKITDKAILNYCKCLDINPNYEKAY